MTSHAGVSEGSTEFVGDGDLALAELEGSTEFVGDGVTARGELDGSAEFVRDGVTSHAAELEGLGVEDREPVGETEDFLETVGADEPVVVVTGERVAEDVLPGVHESCTGVREGVFGSHDSTTAPEGVPERLGVPVGDMTGDAVRVGVPVDAGVPVRLKLGVPV